MYDVVMPYLYREVVIPYDSEAALAKLQLMLHGRRCLPIRGIMLIQETPYSDGSTYLERSVRQLLFHLPDNTLTYLEWNGDAKITLELLRALWKHHEKIRFFRLPPEELSDPSESVASHCKVLRSLGSVIHLNLMLKYPYNGRAALEAVENLDLSRLKGLTLGSQRADQQESIQPLESLPKILFSETLLSTLVTLQLVEIDLSATGRDHGLHGSFFRIELSALKRLEIWDCSNVDSFMFVARVPGLKHLQVRHRKCSIFDKRSHVMSLENSLHIFLRECDGLETLISHHDSCSVAVSPEDIFKHASTLRMYLSDHGAWLPFTDFHQLKVLKQLTVNVEPIIILPNWVQAMYCKEIVSSAKSPNLWLLIDLNCRLTSASQLR